MLLLLLLLRSNFYAIGVAIVWSLDVMSMLCDEKSSASDLSAVSGSGVGSIFFTGATATHSLFFSHDRSCHLLLKLSCCYCHLPSCIQPYCLLLHDTTNCTLQSLAMVVSGRRSPFIGRSCFALTLKSASSVSVSSLRYVVKAFLDLDGLEQLMVIPVVTEKPKETELGQLGTCLRTFLNMSKITATEDELKITRTCRFTSPTVLLLHWL